MGLRAAEIATGVYLKLGLAVEILEEVPDPCLRYERLQAV